MPTLTTTTPTLTSGAPWVASMPTSHLAQVRSGCSACAAVGSCVRLCVYLCICVCLRVPVCAAVCVSIAGDGLGGGEFDECVCWSDTLSVRACPYFLSGGWEIDSYIAMEKLLFPGQSVFIGVGGWIGARPLYVLLKPWFVRVHCIVLPPIPPPPTHTSRHLVSCTRAHVQVASIPPCS